MAFDSTLKTLHRFYQGDDIELLPLQLAPVLSQGLIPEADIREIYIDPTAQSLLVDDDAHMMVMTQASKTEDRCWILLAHRYNERWLATSVLYLGGDRHSIERLAEEPLLATAMFLHSSGSSVDPDDIRQMIHFLPADDDEDE